ncbi:MAG: hypothetical protein RLY31_1128 [Bacteroidota bacterium]|jgi:hypothetical protein
MNRLTLSILTALLLTTAPETYAQQDVPRDILDRTLAYFQATESKNWDAVADMIYPRFFEVVPKERLLEVFSQMEQEGLTMQMRNFDVRNVSNIIRHGKESFVQITYEMEMSISFTSVEYRDSLVQRQIHRNFESIYGAEQVRYDAGDFRFDITANRKMFGVSGFPDDQWYFIENDVIEEGGTTGQRLIPPEVWEQVAPAGEGTR